MSALRTVSEQVFLADLDDHRAASIRLWADDLNRLINAGRGDKLALAKSIASRHECKVSTVYAKRKRYEEGGIEALLDSRGRAARKTGTPQAFRDWVADKYRDFQRSLAGPTVYDSVIEDWEKWRRNPLDESLKIPGYDTPPEASPESSYTIPKGWSLRSIQNMRPGDVDLINSRQGPTAARVKLPGVLTTRVGTKVGEILQIDDFWHDVQVLCRKEVTRALGFGIMDVHSGCDVSHGLKPRQRYAKEGEKSLTESEAMWLVLDYLLRYGYRTDTTTILVCEAGTATIRPDVERYITEATDGQFVIQRAQISGKAFAGLGYQRRAKGNPRYKASRESWFNLLHNRLAMLKGGTGLSKDFEPEENLGMIREAESMAGIADETLSNLPEAVRNQLLYRYSPILPWNQFVTIENAINEQINRRTRHKLEGWATLGYETIDYLLPDGSGKVVNQDHFAALPDHTRTAIEVAISQGHNIYQPRNLSPREVFDSHRHELRKVSPFLLHRLVPAQFAKERVTTAQGEIVIQDKILSAEPIHYARVLTRRDGTDYLLSPGQKIRLYMNEIDPSMCMVTDRDGEPLGLATLRDRALRKDEHAIHSQMGAKEHLYQQLVGPSIPRANRIGQERKENREKFAEEVAQLEAHQNDARNITPTPSEPDEEEAEAAYLEAINQLS